MPPPTVIPSLGEVFPLNITILNNSTSNSEDLLKLVKPNDPVIKQVADKIVTIACDGQRICQVKAIFYFVKNNFDYVPNTYGYVKSARESLVSGNGDCVDASVLIANLMEAIDIRSRFVFIPGHVYVQIWLPKALSRYKIEENWINVDATCKNCSFGEISVLNLGMKKKYLGG